MDILVINAGSSSLKYQLINMKDNTVAAKGLCDRIGIKGSLIAHTSAGKETVTIEKEMKNHADAIRYMLDAMLDKNYGAIDSLDEIAAVGHRVVHGGEFFKGSVIINHEVEDAIKACFDLAPLHNPANLTGIEACENVMTGVPQVAVFDTAFHQTMPDYAYMYAIPYEYYEKYKIRRYGFHGTSHKYVASRAAAMLNKPIEEINIVTCHLGNGSSIAAIKGGKSVDTSMGFTPLAGVAMGTRSGDIDPAIVTFLMEKENKSFAEISDVLNKKSGILGISGVSSDFRDVMSHVEKGEHRAELAIEKFCYSVRNYIAEYAGVMGGVDAVVFTAGIGENNAFIRKGCIKNLEFMGIVIDDKKNEIRGQELDISKNATGPRVLVIPTNEELMIAKETEKLVNVK